MKIARKTKAVIIALLMGSVSAAYADNFVPVLDFSTDRPMQRESRRQQPLDQQISILSRRLDNYDEQHLVAKLDALQHQVEQLRGQLDVQTHATMVLRKQQQQFYQDLNSRLNSLHKQQAKAPTRHMPAAPSAQPASLSTTGLEQDHVAYRAAFKLLRAKRYPQVINAFKQFIARYPNSPYVVNAHYWSGEVYQVQGDLPHAIHEFETVITHYPASVKAADSLYKLAMIAHKAGHDAQAQQYFKKIVSDFPHSKVARLARGRLQLSQSSSPQSRG